MAENVEITKTFKTQSGKTITVTGRLILQKEIWLDGDTDTVATCEKHIVVEAEGHGVVSYTGDVRKLTAAEKKQAPSGYNWVCERLGLTDAQADIIRSVKNEIEQHPAWQAKLARIARAEKELEEYERTNGRLLRAMDREDSDY